MINEGFGKADRIPKNLADWENIIFPTAVEMTDEPGGADLKHAGGEHGGATAPFQGRL